MKRMLVVVATLAVTQIAMAQYSTEGFALRPHLSGASWTIDNTAVDAESGGGFGLGVDYGFNNLVAAYLELSAASIDGTSGDAYVLAHFDLGARFTLGKQHQPLKFTLNAALSGRAAEIDTVLGTLEASGSGFTIGGGVEYFLSRALALDFNLQLTGGEIDEVKIGGIAVSTSVDASSARANLGVVWMPGRR